MHRRFRPVVALFVLVCGLAMPSPARSGEPKPEPPPAEKAVAEIDYEKLAGVWSSEWGPVTLQVTDKHVTGRWEHGTFVGDFDEKGVLTYVWTQDDGQVGRGIFQVVGERLEGRWGFGSSENNGGDWNLFRDTP